MPRKTPRPSFSNTAMAAREQAEANIDPPVVKRTVPAANTTCPQTTGVASVFSMAQAVRAVFPGASEAAAAEAPQPPARKPQKPRQPALAALDPAEVPIRRGVPLPPLTGGRRSDKAKALRLLERMAPGDMVEVPAVAARSMASAARKAHITVALRKINETTHGVWRLPDPKGTP